MCRYGGKQRHFFKIPERSYALPNLRAKSAESRAAQV